MSGQKCSSYSSCASAEDGSEHQPGSYHRPQPFTSYRMFHRSCYVWHEEIEAWPHILLPVLARSSVLQAQGHEAFLCLIASQNLTFFPEVSIVLWVYLDILDGLPTNVPWEHASTKAATHWRIWVHSIEQKRQNSLSWGWTGRRGSTGEKSWTRRYSLGDSLAQLTVLLTMQIYNLSLMLPTMGSYFQFNSNKLVDNAQPCRT